MVNKASKGLANLTPGFAFFSSNKNTSYKDEINRFS